jgi:hypothetical protein
MANVLVVTGNTRVTWSLSDPQTDSPVSRSAEQKSSRSITNGTGPNQANVAHTQTYRTTGLNSVSLDPSIVSVTAFGIEGYAAFSTVKELLLQVVTGPADGFVTLRAPPTITGIRVNAGGQCHWIDYLSGITPSGASISVQPGITGTYEIELSIIGNGSFLSLF